MNYMWWLSEKQPKKINFFNTYVYDNMVAEFRAHKPVITTKSYFTQNYSDYSVQYYYNAIPFLDENIEVLYAPNLNTESECKITFPDESAVELKKLSGKFIYSLKAMKINTQNIVLIDIIYDDFSTLISHVKFLLACVATDYEKLLVNERIAIGEQIQAITKDVAFSPKAHQQTPENFFRFKEKVSKPYVAKPKKPKAKLKRDEYGRFLPKETRDK